MKKINFNYSIKQLKNYTNYKKNVGRYILNEIEINLFILSIITGCLLCFTNSVLIALSVLGGLIVVKMPFQIKMLNDFKKDYIYNKASAEDLLEDLEFDVLKNKDLTKNDLKNSYDYVKSISIKEEILNGKIKVKSRKKVVDYCMLSEKEKIVILRQVINKSKSNKCNCVNVNTYMLDDEDKKKEQFIKCNEMTNDYNLNRENPVVKKLIKNKK